MLDVNNSSIKLGKTAQWPSFYPVPREVAPLLFPENFSESWLSLWGLSFPPQLHPRWPVPPGLHWNYPLRHQGQGKYKNTGIDCYAPKIVCGNRAKLLNLCKNIVFMVNSMSLSEAKLHTNLVEQGAGNTHGVKTPTAAVSSGMPPGLAWAKVVRRSLGRLGTLLQQRFGWFWAGHTPRNDCLSLTLNLTSSPESLSSSITVSGIPTTCSPFTSPWWDQHHHQKEKA